MKHNKTVEALSKFAVERIWCCSFRADAQDYNQHMVTITMRVREDAKKIGDRLK